MHRGRGRHQLQVIGRTLTVALVLVLTGVAAGGVAGASNGVAAQSFATCDEAAAAGFSDMAQGSPGYAAALDRDGDGLACGDGDSAPTTTTPAEVLGTAQTAEQPPGELASTGTTSWILAGVALALVLVGHRMVQASYDRLDWVTGRRHADVRFTVEPVRRPRR